MACCDAAAGGGVGDVIRSTPGVAFGVALFGLANGGLFALIGVRLSDSAGADALGGLVSSAYFLGTLTTALTGGRLVARMGHVRAFTLFAFVAGLSTVALSMSSSETAWPFLRYLTGCGVGVYYVVVESWFNHAATNRSRGRSLAYYESVRLTSVAAGSLVFLNVGDVLPIDTIVLAGVLYMAAIAPVTLNTGSRPPIARFGRTSVKAIVAAAPLGAWCCFAGGLATGAIYGLLPLYGAKLGLANTAVSILIFVNHFAALIVQYPIGAAADRFGRRPVILGMTVLFGAAAISVAVVETPSLIHLLAASVIVGGVAHTFFTAGAVHANDGFAPAAYVHGAATLNVAYGAGTSAGPLVASLAMAASGPAGLYWFMAMLAAFTAAFALVDLIRSPQPPRA